MRRLRLLQLQLLPITGLALLWAALAAAAQDDSGTLEVLVEDASGPRSPDGTPALTFQERPAPTFLETDLGPGRSFTEAGEQIGTGAGRLITPTVTKLELPTEASDYPEDFYNLTKDWPTGLGAGCEGPVRLQGLLLAAGHAWSRIQVRTIWAGMPKGISGYWAVVQCRTSLAIR